MKLSFCWHCRPKWYQNGHQDDPIWYIILPLGILGIRSGLWEDFGRFLIDFGPLLGPLGRPFWEPLGTLGQFLDLQTSKMRGFSTPRFWIQFGLHSGRPKNVKMELSCTREHRFQYSRDVHMGSILDSIWKQKGNQNPNYTPSGEHFAGFWGSWG